MKRLMPTVCYFSILRFILICIKLLQWWQYALCFRSSPLTSLNCWRIIQWQVLLSVNNLYQKIVFVVFLNSSKAWWQFPAKAPLSPSLFPSSILFSVNLLWITYLHFEVGKISSFFCVWPKGLQPYHLLGSLVKENATFI